MKYLLIYLLNLADYALTVYLTGLYGIECEINPLMRHALSVPGVFELVKLVLFPILLLWMWYKKKNDLAWLVLGMFIIIVLLNSVQAFGLYG